MEVVVFLFFFVFFFWSLVKRHFNDRIRKRKKKRKPCFKQSMTNVRFPQRNERESIAWVCQGLSGAGNVDKFITGCRPDRWKLIILIIPQTTNSLPQTAIHYVPVIVQANQRPICIKGFFKFKNDWTIFSVGSFFFFSSPWR